MCSVYYNKSYFASDKVVMYEPLLLYSLRYTIASVRVCATDRMTIGIPLRQGYEGAVDGKLVTCFASRVCRRSCGIGRGGGMTDGADAGGVFV